jgi:hypothetical protein
VAAVTNAITTYTQDLAADQSQVLASATSGATTDYLYGDGSTPLASLAGCSRTWYEVDGQGSVVQALTDAGTVTGTRPYDPYRQVGATGEAA